MITITESAKEKIQELMDSQDTPGLFLRLAVKEGGCSGFSYGMGLDDENQEGDEALDVNGLKVVIAGDSRKYLNGVEIDYKDMGMGGGFTIDNPNAVATCGCGNSFRHREEEGQVEKCDD
ncbi:hypothetical protein J31TS4_40060 [Paenibacillus sp. J31TS4]|uniref:HesB/IscA family protein n=1 Tax=Paenibacillus sp. J31TS4 TaxID=2807195 RepID=UPI001B1C4B79|nr:iron-sulfur cluster assembly accessory protein [Paenibacillus sp. J31TS4]GIP40726.1 hypothetical protein J31TS4_40060 [Paenibacillus sp. J31TS4]